MLIFRNWNRYYLDECQLFTYKYTKEHHIVLFNFYYTIVKFLLLQSYNSFMFIELKSDLIKIKQSQPE